MRAELLAIYIEPSKEYVRSSKQNTSEARFIKLFATESQVKNFIHNNGISEYDCKVVKVILEVLDNEI